MATRSQVSSRAARSQFHRGPHNEQIFRAVRAIHDSKDWRNLRAGADVHCARSPLDSREVNLHCPHSSPKREDSVFDLQIPTSRSAYQYGKVPAPATVQL